jgi:glycosyltransferase involved in cell wall biosynthesis
MKIAILSPFYPFRGGMAQFSEGLFPELEKNNEVRAYTYTTLYPGFLFPGKTQFVEEGSVGSTFNKEKVLSSINPFSYITTAKKINRYSPDYLIIPYWISFLAPALGTVVRLLNKNIKVVALVHNAIPHEKRFFDAPFAKYLFQRCDAFIVLSEAVQKDLMKLVPKAKILLKPHPIYDHYKERISRVEASAKIGVDPNKKNLLFFGLIREYKGLDMLIEAMSYLDESYQLIIAGECYGDFKKYQSLIDESPFKDNIKVFEQYIPDDKVTDFFSTTDLLVLPYRSATQSGVVAVAYQMELPMLATNVGGLGETIRSANVGIVTDEVSSLSIAEGIKSYFTDSKQDEYLTNIRNEKKRLSWSSFAKSVEDFMQGIA